MGNDGGSIPTRRELVKTSATNPSSTALKEKQREHLAHRWSQCPVSHKALSPPIVSDYTGDLYNKDAIIRFLLPNELDEEERREYEDFIQGRIRSLKDVVEVKFEVEMDEVEKRERFLCPVTGKELGSGSGVRAVYLVPCGHAFSVEAVREVKGGECGVCGEKYEDDGDGVVAILPATEEEKRSVMERMERLRAKGLTHALKKEKKGKRKGGEVGEEEGGGAKRAKGEVDEAKKRNGVNGENGVRNGGGGENGIKNSATASLTKRVLQEEEARKQRKLDNENIASLYAKKNGEREKDGSFMTRGFSVK